MSCLNQNALSKAKLALATIAMLVATGCSYFQFPGVHKFNIQQGHILTQEMIDDLEPGMTKRQVAFVLGNPLLEDTFNPDRWDYYYSLKRPSGEFIQRHLTVFFENDQMISYSGDYKPVVEGEAAASGDVELDAEEQEFTAPEEPPVGTY